MPDSYFRLSWGFAAAVPSTGPDRNRDKQESQLHIGRWHSQREGETLGSDHLLYRFERNTPLVTD